jgi:hypothetical protein
MGSKAYDYLVNNLVDHASVVGDGVHRSLEGKNPTIGHVAKDVPMSLGKLKLGHGYVPKSCSINFPITPSSP